MRQSEATTDGVLAELISIKRLLVYGLRRAGASQSDVAEALGIDQSRVSRMFASKGEGSRKKGARRKR
jgi:predicted transcriptional regulator